MKIGSETISTLAYIPLHYGKDYFKAVLTSIEPFVDTILILYTGLPSYGHQGQLKNPDSRDELLAIAEPFSKVVWQDVQGISRENTHREMAYTYARNSTSRPHGKNYDLVMAVDSDEIWNPDRVEEALHAAFHSNYHFHGIGGGQWWHFWKGHTEVNRDGFYPMRLVNLNNNVKNHDILHVGEIYHMGYAINEELMRYKLSCHGHKSEIPTTWFNDKWLNYERGVTTHLHPASRDIWIETEIFEGKLPDYV